MNNTISENESKEDQVTSFSDVVLPDYRIPTKFDSATTMISKKYISNMKSAATGGMSTTDYIASMKSSTDAKNLCGKHLANGKRCQTENVGGCANTGCSDHYGWQDEVEGFRLRTF